MNQYSRSIFIFLSVLLSPSLLYADTINLTTYYPAPFGAYSQLQLVPQDGTSLTCDAASAGLMYVDMTGQIVVCQGASGWAPSSPWSQNAAYTWLTDSEVVANAAWKVGIGVDNPIMKLHLAQDGGILATGTLGSGASIGDLGAGTRFLWYPQKAALRAGQVDAAQWDNANIGTHTTAFGLNNQASADYSVALGGRDNIVSTSASGIVSGDSNEIRNTYSASGLSFIGGGQENIIDYWHSAIVGGYQNVIDSNAQAATDGRSFIGGGYQNRVAARQSGIVSGRGNTINGELNFIGGGQGNTIAGTSGYSFIAGGLNNTVAAQRSAIGGGEGNQILANGNNPFNFIGGGANNTLNGGASFIGGGGGNINRGSNSTIGGGVGNLIDVVNNGQFVTIAGGSTNIADGYSSAIGGGIANEAYGNSSVAGGAGNKAGNNTAGSDRGYAFIGGGQNNYAAKGDVNNPTNMAGFSVVGGGKWNIANGRFATIIGGGLDFTSCPMGGGGAPLLDGDGSPVTCATWAGNIASGYSSFIGGGSNNFAIGDGSMIAGGAYNRAAGTRSAAMGTNAIVNGNYTFVWEGSGAATAVAENNAFVVFPSGAGNMIVGAAANAPPLPAVQDGPYRLYVNGPIGGKLDPTNSNEGILAVNCNALGKCYATYAP